MLLALLADTHDNQAATRTALALLAPRQPAAYIHAGDLVAPDMLDLFAGLTFHFVFGNNEYDHAALRSRALALNLNCHEHLADLNLAGKRLAVLHGHDTATLIALARCGKYHYIIRGHTHLRSDERVTHAAATTRVINPGAVHRARIRSVALLNLATDHLEFLELPAR